MPGRSSNFLSGFISGTVCSAFAFFLYNHDRSSKRLHTNVESNPDMVPTPSTEKYLQLRGREILKYGVPDRGPDVRLYHNHVLCYDQSRKIPLWVAEHITQSDLKGPANRKNSHFKVDPKLHTFFTSQNSDYKNSGWSRGHMAPAGNNKHSQEAMDETFYLSNILPQDFNNNSGFWNRMEMYCRDLTERFPNVRVISGPLMMAYTEEGGKQFIKYEVIGANGVAAPTHLFKVIVADITESPESPKESVAVGAFVVPNQPIGSSAQLKQYKVALEDLEKLAGIHFLPDLPLSKRTDLCSIDSCQLIPQAKLDMYIVGRKLESAKTVEKLDSVWADMERKGLIPDDYLKNLYKDRRESLSSDR